MFLFLIAQTAAEGQAFDRGVSVRSPAQQLWLRHVLAVCSLALGKLAAVLLLQECRHLGGDGMSCSLLAPHPRLFI